MHAHSAFTNASGATLNVLFKDMIRMYAFSQEGIYWFLGGYELRFKLKKPLLTSLQYIAEAYFKNLKDRTNDY